MIALEFFRTSDGTVFPLHLVIRVELRHNMAGEPYLLFVQLDLRAAGSGSDGVIKIQAVDIDRFYAALGVSTP